MNATTVAVDLAKNVFELAVADGGWQIVERARGIEVRLLPPQYVRAYVKRNKTDAAGLECNCLIRHHSNRAIRKDLLCAPDLRPGEELPSLVRGDAA